MDNFDAIRQPVKEADRRPGPYPYYGASGIVDSVDDYLFDGEYLLVAEDGENLRTRNTPVAFIAKGRFWVNNHAHIVKANNAAETRYLAYALQVADIASYLTGSTMPKLTQSNMNRVPVVGPPLAIQRAIVDVLAALDDKIDANRQMNVTLEAMARALFKSWFVDFDPVRAKMAGRPPLGMDATTDALFPAALESTGIGLLPSGWGPVRLGDVFALKRGYDLPTSERMPGSVRIVSSSGPSGYHSDAKARGPGVVTGRYGTIGNVYLIWDDFWPLNTALYVHDFKGTDIYYAFYLLTGLDFNKFSDKGAVPGVNRNDLHEEPVCRAPPALQRAFAERASLWLSLARDNEDQSRTLAELRDLLLPKLLSGELRIREAEKAVEAAL